MGSSQQRCDSLLCRRLTSNCYRQPFGGGGAVFFCIDSGYVHDVSITGIWQGDPLSLAIFALLTVFPVYQMGLDYPEVELLLYADDLLISFQGTGRHRVATTRKVMAVLAKLGYLSGLHVNYNRTFSLVKSPHESIPEHVADVQVLKR